MKKGWNSLRENLENAVYSVSIRFPFFCLRLHPQMKIAPVFRFLILKVANNREKNCSIRLLLLSNVAPEFDSGKCEKVNKIFVTFADQHRVPARPRNKKSLSAKGIISLSVI